MDRAQADDLLGTRTQNSSIHIRDIDIVGEFGSRARLYAAWDRRLSKRTRFFGAAAVTNTALAELFSRFGVHLFVSRFTSEFLASMGYLLECMNMEWARRILAGAIEADDLDEQIIAAEQTAVQNCLTRLHYADGAGYANTVAEIDRVLTFAGFAGSPGKSFCGVTAYSTVLQHAAAQLGRSASFAVQNDRETIGRMLVRYLRGVAIGRCLDCPHIHAKPLDWLKLPSLRSEGRAEAEPTPTVRWYHPPGHDHGRAE